MTIWVCWGCGGGRGVAGVGWDGVGFLDGREVKRKEEREKVGHGR